MGPQPKKLRPRKGRVLHAQSAFRTYICSNLNLCTLPMSLSYKKKRKNYYNNISNVLLKETKKLVKTKKRSGGGKYKKKKKAKFAGHHQIPILFASTYFIIVMIFYFIVSPDRLKSQVLLQHEKTGKKYKQNILIPSQLPTNSRRILLCVLSNSTAKPLQ